MPNTEGNFTDQIQDNKLQILGKLTASLIHEIRNPLSAIKLNLDYMKMIESEMPAEAVDSVDVCKDALNRIQYLIDNLLTFSRKKINGKKSCSINDISRSAFDIMHSTAESKKIKLILDLDESLPNGNFDKSQLLQVFLNLITNAIESFETEGEIKIRTYKDNTGHIIWEVIDNGSGINDDYKNKIFQDFFTSKIKGTGLGLSVCKMLLKECEADLDFESTEGIGTRFFIKFNPSLIKENAAIQDINHR